MEYTIIPNKSKRAYVLFINGKMHRSYTSEGRAHAAAIRQAEKLGFK